MRRRPAPLTVPPLVAALGALALSLAGCSALSSDEPEEGPLEKYLSALYDEETYNEDFFEKQQEKVEELTAECMADEGFEYQPVPQSGGMVSFSDEDGPEWGSLEFAKEYGYGMASWPGSEEAEEAPPEDEEEYVDPNEDYVDSLSESERLAYEEALWGPQPTEEEIAAMEDGEAFEYDWEASGCQGAAQHEVDQEGPGAASEDPEFADLMTALDEFYSEVYGENDELDKLNREWAECFADTGLGDFGTSDDAQTSLQEEYDALSMPDGEDGEWKEPDPADLKDFKEREIEMAVADAECKKEVGYDEQQADYINALEQEFVDAHKAELDALVAKHGTKKK